MTVEAKAARGFRLGEWTGKALVTAFALGLVSAALALGVGRFAFVALVESWLDDFRLVALAPGDPEPDPNIVIVAITEETLKVLPYRSPVDRAAIAGIVDALREKGAAGLGIDFLFDRPTEPAKDQALMAAVDRFPRPVVMGWAEAGADREDLTAEQMAFLDRFLAGHNVVKGLVSQIKDPDGVVRRLYPGRRDDTGGFVPGLAAALAQQRGVEPPRAPVRLAYKIGEPRDQPPFNVFEAKDLDVVPRELIAGKIALIGVDLPTDDRHRTPFFTLYGYTRGQRPGVELHAHALAQLLERRGVARAGPGAEAAIAAAAALAAVALVTVEVAVAARTAAALLLGFGYWVGAGALAAMGGMLVPLVSPTVGFVLALGAANAYAARRYRAQRAFIRDVFALYLEPKQVQRLLENPALLNTEGESREVTLLFTDLEGFTAMTEKTNPRVLVKVISEYFDGACQVLIEHGGTIDKFVGDAVVAIFNAPTSQPDHAARAVESAASIDRFAEAFRRRVKQEHGVELGRTRIGVHTGTAIVGNFGGRQRHNYTAMGDCVNTASRLEGANKRLGTAICVSAATAAQCAAIKFLPVATVHLKGKSWAVPVFTPVSADEDRSAGTYREGYAKLEGGDTQAAAACFATAGSIGMVGQLARFHLARCQKGERDTLIRLDAG